MTVTSKREQILEYIKSTVLGLPNGNGDYNLTVATKSREFFVPEELRYTEFPAVMVLEDGMTRFQPMTGEKYTTGTQVLDLTDAMPVALAGFVKVDDHDNTPLGTEINKLFSDLVIAMHIDSRMGGLCESIVLVNSLFSVDYSESQGIGMCMPIFAIKYDFNPNAATKTT